MNSRSGSGRSGSGRSGSGSEIYERLPDSGSHGDLVSGSEDSDIYSQMDSLDRQVSGLMEFKGTFNVILIVPPWTKYSNSKRYHENLYLISNVEIIVVFLA